jgi:hypothetical protein
VTVLEVVAVVVAVDVAVDVVVAVLVRVAVDVLVAVDVVVPPGDTVTLPLWPLLPLSVYENTPYVVNVYENDWPAVRSPESKMGPFTGSTLVMLCERPSTSNIHVI